VAASGIGILVSGGQRCRRHLHRDERRTASAMLVVISRRRAVQWSSMEGTMAASSCLVVSLNRTSKEDTSVCMNKSMLGKIQCKF
jgi:hypothetical protein